MRKKRLKTKSNLTPQGEPKQIYLTTPQRCRQLLSTLVHQCRVGKLETDKLRAISYAVDTLLKCFKAGELEQRLQELERLNNELK